MDTLGALAEGLFRATDDIAGVLDFTPAPLTIGGVIEFPIGFVLRLIHFLYPEGRHAHDFAGQARWLTALR